MGMGRTISKLRKATKQLVLAACRSLSLLLHPHPPSSQGCTDIIEHDDNCSLPHHLDEIISKSDSSSSNTHPTSTILCAICLEPLSHCDPGEAMFTGQCSHSFHFSCIASNVCHGSVTCPVCRAHWTHLPRLSRRQQDDPVFRILDDSIATFRVHRCSFLRSARYDDDDPIHPPPSTSYPRLEFSLIPLTFAPNLLSYPSSFQSIQGAYSPLHMCINRLDTNHNQLNRLFSPPSVRPQPEDRHCLCTSLGERNAYLSVKLTNNPQPIDLVLVASPSGPHFRLLKQAMILVTSSLRPVDRLAIVTYSCVAARVFPLRRMTSFGKRAALRVIDRLFYMGQTDPYQGIRKGIKVLKDRAYKNPRCSVLHISSSPIRSYYPNSVMQTGVMVHRFHVGFGTETWGFVMRKLEELLEKVLGGVASDIQLRFGMEGKIVKVGELRGGEEKQVLLLDLGVHVNVRLCYSYVEGDIDECIRRRGETTLSLMDDNEGIKSDECESTGGRDDDYMNTTSVRRSISTETWDNHDRPFMAKSCTVNL